jgi:hypothetical protein
MPDEIYSNQEPTETLPRGESTANQPDTIQVAKDQGYNVGPVGTRGSFEVIAESPDFCTLSITKEAPEPLAADDGSMDSAVNSVDAMFSKKGSY